MIIIVGDPCFHIAALNTNVAIVEEILLSNRFDPTIVSGEGLTCLEAAFLAEAVVHPSKPIGIRERIMKSPTIVYGDRIKIIEMLISRKDLSSFVCLGTHEKFDPISILCNHHNFGITGREEGSSQSRNSRYLETVVRAGFPLKDQTRRLNFSAALNRGRVDLALKMLELEETFLHAPADSCPRFIKETDDLQNTIVHQIVLMERYRYDEFTSRTGFYEKLKITLTLIDDVLRKAANEGVLNLKNSRGESALAVACAHVLIQPRGLREHPKDISLCRLSSFHLALVIMLLESGSVNIDIRDDADKVALDYLIPGFSKDQILSMTDEEIAAIDRPLMVREVARVGCNPTVDLYREYLDARESDWLSIALPDVYVIDNETRGGSWANVKVIFDQIRLSLTRLDLKLMNPLFK